MKLRMSDEELAKHFRQLYGEGCDGKEAQAARRWANIMALIAAIVFMAAITIGVVLAIKSPAHAGVVPSWSPAQTQTGDWLAIYYLLTLIGIGLVIGITKYLKEVRRG
ncbi:MAG: hypothetical protein GX598_03205 [Elusimicrobia bacterium]|nr:hypothetical protein [Elusimicrobiota bacterium]